MIITPFSVLYSIIFGSIYLLFLRITYRSLLRHNCYKIVFYFLSLTALRYMFIVDLPLNTSSLLVFWVSKSMTLFGKTMLDLVTSTSSTLLSINDQIVIGKSLLLIWFGVASILIIRDLLVLRSISKSRQNILISCDENVGEIFEHIKEEMKSSFDVKIIQNSQVLVPFVSGLRHPIIHLGTMHMDDEELDSIMRHELTHVINHDNWLKTVVHYITLFLWWNPLIKLLMPILDEACECRCDNHVTKQMREVTKLNYASMINTYSASERISESDYTKSAYALNKNNDYIYQRVMTFLKPQSFRVCTRCLLMTALVIFSICFFIFSVPTLKQRSYIPSSEVNVVANSSNSYLMKNANGSYSLYTYGMLINSDISDISQYDIPIKEETK